MIIPERRADYQKLKCTKTDKGNFSIPRRLLQVDLLNLVDALVQRTINCRSDSERTTNNGAETDEEARERLVTDFTIDDLHR
jgi:hypothetical protein